MKIEQLAKELSYKYKEGEAVSLNRKKYSRKWAVRFDPASKTAYKYDRDEGYSSYTLRGVWEPDPEDLLATDWEEESYGHYYDT